MYTQPVTLWGASLSASASLSLAPAFSLRCLHREMVHEMGLMESNSTLRRIHISQQLTDWLIGLRLHSVRHGLGRSQSGAVMWRIVARIVPESRVVLHLSCDDSECFLLWISVCFSLHGTCGHEGAPNCHMFCLTLTESSPPPSLLLTATNTVF